MAKTPFAREFDEQAGREICERIAKGESLRTICGPKRDDFIPGQTTVFKWLATNDEFAKQYARARELQADHFVDEIVELADATHVEVTNDQGETAHLPLDHNRARLQIDARKWVASKLLPKKYGDKIALGGDPDAGPIQVIISKPG